LADRFRRLAIFGAERLIVAIRAATGSFASIAIWAGKAGINGYFLNAFRELRT